LQVERLSTGRLHGHRGGLASVIVSPVKVDPSHPRFITTWGALLRHGYTAAQVRANLDAARWQRWGHAIALHNGPLSREQRWYVALMHGGVRSLVTGFSALEAAGLSGWERDRVDVLVPISARGVQGCPIPLRLHRTRYWSEVRREPRGCFHHRVDALLLAASTLSNPRSACGVLAASVQQRLVRVVELEAALLRRTRQRHRAVLLAAARDIGQGAQALSEIDFVALCRRFHLPTPLQQTVRRDGSGRRRYLDATWRRRDGRLVVVEIDGALHLSQQRWWADQLRQNEIMLGNALVLRFPSVVLRTEPELIASQLRRALGLPAAV
jgi:hypothetical protein